MASNLVRLANVRDACRSGAARMIRISAGLSLSEVSREVGAAISTIYRWETGERIPRGKAAIRYARLLEELAERQQPRRRPREGVVAD
jgi:transcriptional regulator with XRE-family HTH domain